MIQAKGYAAPNQHTELAPWSFERRELKPYDVQFDILYCGVCHSDLHQIKDAWGGSLFSMAAGHEIVGRVGEVGNLVKKFKVGELAGTGFLRDTCPICDYCNEWLWPSL